MTQDKIIEIAINAGFLVQADTRQIYIEFGNGYRTDITENVTKLIELIQSQAQPTPSQSEPVAWTWKARQNDGSVLQRIEHWNPISEHVKTDEYMIFDIKPLTYLYPQPTPSQESLPKELNIDDTPRHLPQKEARAYMNGWNACLESINESTQPTPNQSVDERAEFERYHKSLYPRMLSDCGFQIAIHAWKARANLSKPQPTSQKKCEKNMDLLRENYKAIYALFGNDGSVITPIDTKPQPTSQQLLDDAKHCGADIDRTGTYIEFTLAQLAKFLELQAKRTKPQPTPSQRVDDVLDTDTVGLEASKSILNVIANHGIDIFKVRKSQLQAKIQCAVIDAIDAAISKG